MTEAPSLLLALFAGIVSFLSPCVLPLIPAYIGYMSGSTLTAARGGSGAPPGGGSRAPRTGTPVPVPSPHSTYLTQGAALQAARRGAATASPGAAAARAAARRTARARWIVMGHALMFVLGLTLVFVLVIGGLAGAFSSLLRDQKTIFQKVMGVMLVIFGLHSIGAINIPFLNFTRRLDVRPAASLGYFRSLLVGMSFGIGWTPCVGPTLGAIFTLAANAGGGQAFLPALAYSLGLGIPFLLTALAMGQISAGLKRLTRRSYSLKVGRFTVINRVNVISLISGLLLIMMGLLVYTNALTILTNLFPNFGV